MSNTVSTSSGGSADSESFASIFNQEEKKYNYSEGSIIDAMVVDIEGNRVVLDAGLKSPCNIPSEEFRDDKGEINVKKDDFTKVKIQLLDDGRGNIRLSHLQYRRELAWERLVDAYNNNKVIEGVVRERVKGGFSVHIDGLRAFLPGSLVDLFQTHSDHPELIGNKERFYVERLKEESMSAILNRRLVRERELTGFDIDNIKIKEGDEIEGIVSGLNYVDHIAFINLGDGVHGRLHRDDLSWHRITNFTDFVKEGEQIKVVVLEIDKENSLIRVGAKQLTEDPWEQIDRTFPPGTKVFGKVTLIKEYGAFVEIEENIQGLVHVSEMDWLNRNVNPQKSVNVGDEVEVMVLECNKENRRISLSLRACKPNPWEEFNTTYRAGSKLKGKVVERSSEHGLFVEFEGGLIGLVHISNLSYTGNWKKELDKYSIGQEIEVNLISVDLKATPTPRIALGIKQLGQDPYAVYQEKMRSHEVLTAKVAIIQDKHAIVKFEDDVDAFLPIHEVSEERIEKLNDKLKVGDDVKVTIINIETRKVKERERKTILVSMKAVEKALSKERQSKLEKDPNADLIEKTKRSTSFGAMFSQTMSGQEESKSETPSSEVGEDTQVDASDEATNESEKS